jgi:hypothetical protein
MSRDLRKYQRQTTIRLVVAAFLLLFIVGGGLLYLIYGQSTALTALLCMGALMLPVGLVFLFFKGMEWIVKRSKDNDE